MDCIGPSACQNGGECRTAEYRMLGTAEKSNDSAVSCDCPLGFRGDHCQEGKSAHTPQSIALKFSFNFCSFTLFNL